MEQSAARPDRAAFGIALILASVVAMAFCDAVVKLVSADLTVWQIFVTRAIVALPVMIAIMRRVGRGFRLHAPKWALTRTALLVLNWLVFYASLPVLDLSVAAVALYTAPIMIALLSALLIGEPVTRRQWLGVLLGFIGVITILRPGSDAFSWYILGPLLGAFLYALAMVLTRSKCQDEAPLALAISLQGMFLLTGLVATGAITLIAPGQEIRTAFPFLLGDWGTMGVREWGLMALIGLLAGGYFTGVAKAYQIAPPSIIATFDYGYLVSAALWGFVFFTEQPDLLTVCGMVLITAAGLLVAAPKRRRTPAVIPAGEPGPR
ncbi:DMT family transporter [uncultured Nisaea sp.]|uniref:DMT family transporter n=1 Tax=uncultured Nisaea sp. TaxID=538215 RepID=UPI0030EC3182